MLSTNHEFHQICVLGGGGNTSSYSNFYFEKWWVILHIYLGHAKVNVVQDDVLIA